MCRYATTARCALLAAAALSVVTAAGAADPDHLWERLDQLGARVNCARTQWYYSYRVAPNPHVNVDRAAAEAQERAHQGGLSARETKLRVESARQSAQQNRDGWGYSAKMTLQYRDSVVREDEFDLRSNIHPSHLSRLYFSAGDRVNLAANDDEPSHAQGNVSAVGEQYRSFDETFCKFLFLLSAPVEWAFPKDQTAVSRAADGAIVLQRIIQPSVKRRLEHRATLRLSPSTLQPLLFTWEAHVPSGWWASHRVVGSDYREYPGGIVLPSCVVGQALDQRGRPEAWNWTYKLVSASFNEDSGITAQSIGLPRGIGLRDFRLGMDKQVTYAFDKRLPTISELRSMWHGGPFSDEQPAHRYAFLFYACGPLLALALLWAFRRRRR